MCARVWGRVRGRGGQGLPLPLVVCRNREKRENTTQIASIPFSQTSLPSTGTASGKLRTGQRPTSTGPLSGLPHSSAPVLPSPVPTVRVSSADHSTPWGWVPANVKVCQSCPVGAAELSAPLPRHSGVGWGAGEVQGAGREGLLMTESKSGQASSSPFRNTLILTGGILIKS